MTTRPDPAYAPGVRIRDMTVDDCAAVADIRVRGWRWAYAGLIPQPYLEAMDAAQDAERRRAHLRAGGGPVNLVAGAPDAEVTGWACYGPCRDESALPGSAELYALYVHPDRIGTGTGRALLTEVTARARADGFAGMSLWVLKENTRARRFYERAGFRPDGAEEASDTGGAMVPEVRYVRTLTPSPERFAFGAQFIHRPLRRVVAAPRRVTHMWGELVMVDWAALEHNYGSAEDVPGLLRRCAGPDPDDAERAADDLLNNLYHQGGWICSAAPAALPFLLRLAATPDVPSRRSLLELVSRLVSEAGQVAEKWVDPGWPSAWERALPEVLVLLNAPEPEIRRAAADVIGSCRSPGELTLPALLRRWKAEDDPATRLDLILALGRAALQESSGEHGAITRDLLRGLLDAPEAQIRLAAVHAIAPADPAVPGQRLGLLLEAVRDASVELWQDTSTVESGVQGVHHWTAVLLRGPSPSFTLGLLDDHPDVEQRIGGLAQAGGLLAQWRSPADKLLPRLVARLDDPAAEVRFRAAELLACLGPAAAAHADEVAALTGDTGARTTRTRQTVAEAAVWALARMNDPRCVPGLIEAAARPRSGFASNSAHYPSADWHYAVLPALHEVVGHLPDHAELLLPMICGRLDATAEDHVLSSYCNVLADWGPAAEPAVPQLLALLEDDRAWTAAATALAGIGTPGNGALEHLSARSRRGGPHAELAAWACWKVGGEPGPVLEALGRALTEDGFPRPALRILADLGPHAARYAEPLRTMTADAEPWTRIEAAHALWAATGETDSTVPALMTAVRGLAEGTYLPVMPPAVRYLTRIGRAARPAAELLRGVPAHDQRLRSSGGWRGLTQDASLRTAVHELLAACDVEGLEQAALHTPA